MFKQGTDKNARLLCAVFLFMCSTASSNETTRFELIQAIPINGPKNFQPSGLAVCEGKLVAISDKHDKTIFFLNEQGNIANAESAVSLTLSHAAPEPDLPFTQAIVRWFDFLSNGEHYDWEEIACTKEGQIFLVSESFAAIASVDKTGAVHWLPTNAYDAAKREGMLQKYNAFFEGIVWHHGRLYVAAEREPRGLIELVHNDEGKWQAENVRVLEGSELQKQVTDERPEDFSDLFSDGQWIYTLERNASAICQREVHTFDVVKCWSYRHIESDAQYGYQDDRFGLAEGAALVDGVLYVVFDNNGDSRKSDNNDTRPLLLKFSFDR